MGDRHGELEIIGEKLPDRLILSDLETT